MSSVLQQIKQTSGGCPRVFGVKLFNGANAEIVGHIVQPKIAAVKRKFPYLGLYFGRKNISKSIILLSGTADAKKCGATLDALLTTIKSNMAVDEP
jgi:hypothetical protein